jgi:hypothetical protein
MRSEPSDRAEMVNQILFGECYEVIEKRSKWSKVRLAHDQYEGWIDNKQKDLISADFFKTAQGHTKHISTELIDIISDKKTGEFYSLLIGSIIPMYDKATKTAKIEENDFDFLGACASEQETREKMIEYAYQYLNAPYLWGGRSPFGIDCSGFTQLVYRLAGYQLPRDAYQQATHGLTLSFIEESEPGDLAFFDNSEGDIVHVGVILTDNYILHASGKVRLDRLDQTGIFNPETGSHTHKLRVIKKII